MPGSPYPILKVYSINIIHSFIGCWIWGW